MSAKSVPITGYQETLGMLYFARMLDKIRKHARGELREDFTDNLGRGFDGRCTRFLRVGYDDLKARVLQGGSDEEILRWCFSRGRDLDENDIEIWNGFISKRGWRDEASELVARRKKESGLEGRPDVETMMDYFEFDEGRRK